MEVPSRVASLSGLGPQEDGDGASCSLLPPKERVDTPATGNAELEIDEVVKLVSVIDGTEDAVELQPSSSVDDISFQCPSAEE